VDAMKWGGGAGHDQGEAWKGGEEESGEESGSRWGRGGGGNTLGTLYPVYPAFYLLI
jgi:hypothetical protein